MPHLLTRHGGHGTERAAAWPATPHGRPSLPRADRALTAAAAIWLALNVMVLLATTVAIASSAAPIDLLTTGLTTAVLLSGAVALASHQPAPSNTWRGWNRRFYVAGALALALAAMVAAAAGGVGRDAPGWDAGMAVNAAAIGLCAVLTRRHGRSTRHDVHRAWAWRLWLMVACGGWQRVAWLAGAGVGSLPGAGSGASVGMLALAQCLLPLIALEFCLHARTCGTRRSKRLALAGLCALCTATAVGAVAAGVGALGMA